MACAHRLLAYEAEGIKEICDFFVVFYVRLCNCVKRIRIHERGRKADGSLQQLTNHQIFSVFGK